MFGDEDERHLAAKPTDACHSESHRLCADQRQCLANLAMDLDRFDMFFSNLRSSHIEIFIEIFRNQKGTHFRRATDRKVGRLGSLYPMEKGGCCARGCWPLS